MPKEDILQSLSNNIRKSIKTDEVFHRDSSIRGIVYRYFLENYKHDKKISCDMITDRVADPKYLTNNEKFKLEKITTAWSEWEYILHQFGHPEAPKY